MELIPGALIAAQPPPPAQAARDLRNPLVALRLRLRLLLHLGQDFAGFGEGAWGELTSGIRATPFHRGAVVTDDDFIRRGLRVIKWTLRGDVRTFRNRDYERAVIWVSG